MLRALHTFHADGRLVADGELVAETDPIVAGREHLFTAADSGVEEATAVPGAKRTRRAAKPKAAPKSSDG